MKASELRLFNILSFEGQHQYVSSIHSDNTIRLSWVIGGECHGCYRSTDKRIQPIPLTEEWLLKFGFEKEGEQYNIQGISIEDVHNGEKWCFYMFDEYNAVECSLALIQHVHQLQNLYFALTGEELKIEL